MTSEDDREYTFEEYLEEFDPEYYDRNPKPKEDPWLWNIPLERCDDQGSMADKPRKETPATTRR